MSLVSEPDLITIREAMYMVIKSGSHTMEMNYNFELTHLPLLQL